ncbi:MAG: hypothetical protein MI794_16110 [Pseudomonadales bacterium]|nr:hypothetical protein [Pseudomonadales bacterium]
MKTKTKFAALSVAALLSAAPLVVSADDDYRDDDCHEHRRDSYHRNAEGARYSLDEMRVMAQGRALSRFGPGMDVSVEETGDGTYRVQLRDAEQNLIREQEFNLYGAPVRGGRRD